MRKLPRAEDRVRSFVCIVTAFLAMTVAPPAVGQSAFPTLYERAVAAGYKASMLCSSLFNAGRSEAQTEALELTGIYPEYDAIIPTLAATVDRHKKTVSVPFNPALPDRIAAWRPNLGCAQLPIGASAEVIKVLPRFDRAAPAFDALPWPMGEHDAVAKARGDRAALAKVIASAFDGRTYGDDSRSTGVLVVQNGHIIAEQYASGFGPHVSHRTWSIAKSITGTLIGIAAYEGKIALDEAANIPEWSSPGDPRAAITIRQLLQMSSGLHGEQSGNRTDAIYFGGSTVQDLAANWGLDAKPGTRFRYANNDTMIAAYALRQRIGAERVLAYPFTNLFWKIGMTRTVPETDWKGNFILSSQVWSTARDLARLGMLYLANGKWQGEQLFAADWRGTVSAPAGPQPEGEIDYGLGVWLLNKSAGVPADTFAAFGSRGQFLIIVPSREVVIIRRGEDANDNGFDYVDFTAAVLAALR